jgi:hypothetical protein
MPRTYQSGVTATRNQDAPVDPMRPVRDGRQYHDVSVEAVARGILQSLATMDALLRLAAWVGCPELDELAAAREEDRSGRGERLEGIRGRQ